MSRPRYAILVGLILTYIWRFQDLRGEISQLRLAAICTVGAWAYLILKPRLGVLRRASRLPYVALFLAFSLWGLLTVPFALNPELASSELRIVHLKSVTMVLFVITCLTSMTEVRLALTAQAVGGAVLAFFYIKAGFPQWGTPVPMYDRNDLAMVLNVALPTVLFLAFTARGQKATVAWWIVALSMATSVVMSQSRGGFLTIAMIVVATLVSAKGLRLRYRILPPILLFVGFFFLPSSIQDRLSTIFEKDYNYTEETGRIQIWQRGVGYLLEHPITGVGWENFRVAEATISEMARQGRGGRGKAAHNSFVQVGVETGVVGFLLYAGMILTAVWRLVRLRLRLRRYQRVDTARDLSLCADFLVVSIVGFVVGAQFLSMGYSVVLFVLIAFTAGLEMSAESWQRGLRRQRGNHQSGRLRRNRPAAIPAIG